MIEKCPLCQHELKLVQHSQPERWTLYCDMHKNDRSEFKVLNFGIIIVVDGISVSWNVHNQFCSYRAGIKENVFRIENIEPSIEAMMNLLHTIKNSIVLL
jgi:hypothetical protein